MAEIHADALTYAESIFQAHLGLQTKENCSFHNFQELSNENHLDDYLYFITF